MPSRAFSGLCAGLVSMALVLWAGAAQAKQYAFVAGINVYDNLSRDQQLRKAVNDGKAVAAAFRQIGFEVFSVENVDRRDFLRTWQRFLDAVKPGDTTAFYFAGHGFEINGSNYLLTRDVTLASDGEAALRGSSLRVGELLDQLKDQQPQVTIFIIDACRNNPFAGGTRSIGGKVGLRREEPPSGTLIMMSAGAGQEALDALSGRDPSANSVYTRSLIPLLLTPGLEVTDLAKRVRSDVEKLAATVQHRQRPSFYHELSGDFYLMPKRSEPALAEAGQDQALVAWENVRHSSSPGVLDAYARQFGGSPHAAEARSRAEQLRNSQAARIPVPGPAPREAAAAPPREAAAAPPREAPIPEPEARRAEAPFRDCDQCPEMVTLPAGSFTMGSLPGEEGRTAEEGPVHQVTFARPFAVGRFAISHAEWDACVAGGGCNGYKPSDLWHHRDQYPVVNVSHADAKAYAEWLSRITGRRYRLLTEAEREYAGRAGTTTPFWWGASITARQANYDGTPFPITTAKDEPRRRTLPINFFAPNAWGLYQVHGNISEWVEDCFHPSYAGAPQDGSAWLSPSCSHRVTRGGSWLDNPQRLRAASRASADPGRRASTIGFRVARDP